VTRIVMGFLAVDRAHYEGQTYITGDVELYRLWATQIHDPASAYGSAKVQYPPGSLPFIVAPGIGHPNEGDYLVRFVAMMAAVDLLGAAVLYRLGRRYLSTAGLWVWTLALPALGPIVFDRVDLPPAVATILGLGAADSGALVAAGAWFGFATVAKLYPILLVPQLITFASSRPKVALGFSAVVVASVVAFAGDLGALWSSVLGYHSARGVQVESDWGLALLFAAHGGYQATVVYDFGSFNVITAVSDTLKRMAEGLSILVTLAGAVTAWSRRRSGTAALAGIMFSTLGFVMATGTVLSPQYLIWLSALGAVAATVDGRLLRPALLLVPTGILTQIVYPFLYGDLLAAHTPELIMLAARNGLLVIASGWAFVTVLTGRRRTQPVASPPA
jgi:hypothetical protein